MYTIILRDEIGLEEIEASYGLGEEDNAPPLNYLRGLRAYLGLHGKLVREHYHELEEELEKTDVHISRFDTKNAHIIVRHTEYWEDMFDVFQNPMRQTVTVKIYSRQPFEDLVKGIRTALQELPEYQHEH